MPVKQVDRNRFAVINLIGSKLLKTFCRNRIRVACLLAGVLCGGSLSAQQEGNQLTQFMLNTYAYNAGYAGLSNGIAVSALHRQQWLGMGRGGSGQKGVAPNSTILLADMPLKILKGGVGLEVASFNAAYFKDIHVKIGYSYHLQTSFGTIGMGVRAQLESKGLDFSKFDPENASDRILTGKQKENGMYGDVSVGFYLLGNANYFVGIAANNLVAHKSEKISFRPSRHIAVNGGYSFSFSSLPKVEFTPTAYLETDFTTVSWSLAVMGTFNKRFWAGLSYRFQDAVSILAGINIAKLQIGASYDITASRFIKASTIGGAFEISVKYCFGLEGEKVNTEYKNARYL
ncbi:MAG: PorP/SprF family type IX secretion system membrane protein [Bacteroides sp.]|nr:PorP/SprF family type IX secretion system membrane protein [Bacteroides sp.]MCM1086148.1 PorP/SprF family type IX secretion system membrane protein [Bacteroides sp.]